MSLHGGVCLLGIGVGVEWGWCGVLNMIPVYNVDKLIERATNKQTNKQTKNKKQKQKTH